MYKGKHIKRRAAGLPAAGSRNNEGRGKSKRRKKLLIWLAAVVVVLGTGFLTVTRSHIPFIVKLRNIYIETAMTTLSHQWLATALFPGYIIEESMAAFNAVKQEQAGLSSSWGIDAETAPTPSPSPTPEATPSPEELELQKMEAFFAVFDVLDRESVVSYAQEHPEAIENGWEYFDVNEAGLEAGGTSMYTTGGEQVLAVSAEYGILLLRVTGDGYRGVLAIAKDPSLLSIAKAPSYGSMGALLYEISERAGSVLSMNASSFSDPEGTSWGDVAMGTSVSNGEVYGNGRKEDFKRIELREDNRMYIVDDYDPIGDDVTDATEFSPALVIDGEIVVTSDSSWSLQPRAAVGQTTDEEILFLVIEGRQPLKGVIGTNMYEVALIMEKYDCYQGMAIDGGSSAIIWYKGESVTMCSNGNILGRHLPDAWVIVPEGGYTVSQQESA